VTIGVLTRRECVEVTKKNVAQQQESGSDLCSAQQRSYALIAFNLATLYTQRDIINRKIFLEDSRLMNIWMCSD